MSFSHVDETGAARMVDVSAKEVTVRTATAVPPSRTRMSLPLLLQKKRLMFKKTSFLSAPWDC